MNDDFISKFAEFEVELAKFARIFVGFSGGADSTALLILLAKLAKRHSYRIEVVHFEHGIRGDESVADAKWCREFSENRLHVILGSTSPSPPFRVVELNLDPDSRNLEAAARNARMDCWRRLTDGDGDAVALGHHADDKIENLFLRLLRGSNATGLTSPRISRNVAGVRLLRPLLLVRRSEVESFLRSLGVEDWREDRTNAENKQSRNFIRNEVIPMIRGKFPDAEKALLSSIAALEDDATHLETEAEKVHNAARRWNRGESRPALDTAIFADASPALRPRVCRLWLVEALEIDNPPSRDLIERLTAAVEKIRENRGKNELIPLNADAFIEVDASLMQVVDAVEVRGRMADSIAESVAWNWKNVPEIEWNGHRLSARIADAEELFEDAPDSRLIDRSCRKVFFAADGMPDELLVKQRAPGDKMTPYGADDPVRIKKIMQNSNLPARMKKTLPVLSTPDGTNIWIPLARRANFANLVPDPKGAIVELSLIQ